MPEASVAGVFLALFDADGALEAGAVGCLCAADDLVLRVCVCPGERPVDDAAIQHGRACLVVLDALDVEGERAGRVGRPGCTRTYARTISSKFARL